MIKQLFPVMLLGFALASQAIATSYTYKTFDPPAGSIDILPNRMNNNGQVVGTYIDSMNKWHGFVYSNSVFTSIDVPDAGYTNVKGINNNGQLIGEYSNSAYGYTHGFLLNNGAFTTIDLPDFQSTMLKAINDSGQILGYGTSVIARPPIPYPDIFHKSFVYRDGIITIPSSGFDQAVPLDINASGQILGRPFCSCFGSIRPGPSFYVYDNTTGSQLFTPPNAVYGGSPVSISDNGQVLGTYFGINETYHAYIYNKGVYTTLNFPWIGNGSIWVNDINNVGQVVGYYNASDYHTHGFLYNGGAFTPFDIPGALDTSLVGNNVSSQLIGTYTDSAGVKHGYIATPITAKPTTEKQCKKNGWKTFGFKNRKACIKYVESLEEDDDEDEDEDEDD